MYPHLPRLLQPAGLYFVKVYTDKGTYSKKIVLTGN